MSFAPVDRAQERSGGRDGSDLSTLHDGVGSGGVPECRAASPAPTRRGGVLPRGTFGRVPVQQVSVTSSTPFFGIRQTSEGGGSPEPDVHSNSIDAGLGVGSCTSRAVGILVPPGGTVPPRGVYRNNVLRATNGCTGGRFGLWESNASADPRVVQNNDFFDAPSGLYFDEGTTARNSAVAIDGMTDISVGGSVVGDPMYVFWPSDVHLSSAAVSPCRRAGTTIGAPATDFDGQARPAPAGTNPDIGADEDAL